MTRPIVVGLGEALWDLLPDGDHFGGAPANVAVHAAALGGGAESWLVSAVGRDARGESALARLETGGVQCGAVARIGDRPTGVVRVTLDTNGHPIYDIAVESAWDYVPWSAAVQQVVERADAVAFGSLAQRSAVSRATIRRAVNATRRSTLRLFDVNLRQHYYDAAVLTESLKLASAVKLNEEELPVVCRLCGAGGATPVDQLRALQRQRSVVLREPFGQPEAAGDVFAREIERLETLRPNPLDVPVVEKLVSDHVERGLAGLVGVNGLAG